MEHNSRYQELEGVEKATDDLLNAVRSKGREIVIARPGTSEYRYLEYTGAEGNVGNADLKHILLRENPSKAAVLEEFIHGVQHDIGIAQTSANISWREYHAKDFMVRHQSLIGLGEEDVARLKYLRDRELGSEITQALREEWLARRAVASIDHHASRGVGVAGMAVDVASGNYTSAAVGAVMEVAQDDRVQKTMIETALEQSGNVARVFGQAAKRTPLVGTVVTGGYVLYEAGGYALDGEWGKAAAATTAGLAEAGGNIVGFGVGDAAREMVRGGIIATAGDEYAVEKSGLRQLGEAAIDVGGQMLSGTAPKGVPLQEVLPQNYREMTQGADEMGERSDVKRIAVERTGLAANDAGNSLQRLAADPQSPKAHILILADGSVQGPADGGVPFEHNPRIAAGRNSETLGVLYAGEGAMNDAQYRTVLQLQGWLSEQRQGHGVPSSSAPLFAGSYDTAALLKLPTPKQAELGMTSTPTPTTTPPRYNASFNAAAMG